MAPARKARNRNSKKISSIDEPPTFSAIQELHDTSKKRHGKAPNTTKKYSEYVVRGRNWLQDTFDLENVNSDASLWSKNGESTSSPGDREAFRHAFDDAPNEYSPRALALFLSFKIFHENLSESTAEGIYSAFKALWKHSADEKYRGTWHFNDRTNEWQGNPADSACVQDIREAIKHKCGAEGGDRKHSLAMSKGFMEKVYTWSIKQFPVDTSPLPDIKKEAEHVKHLMYRAFSALGFCLWTRNVELITAKRKQVTFNLEDAEFYDMPYIDFRLTDRKGWQRKVDRAKKEDDLKANEYVLYNWEGVPSCDGKQQLEEWVAYLEKHVYRHPLEPDDYLFPAISANGIVQRGEHVTHDTIQKWITEFTVGAKIITSSTAGTFTTHCFRRGGAQYRFLFAPGKERWPLHIVRWWGGWADGEHRDTLIKYLLDELHTYETNYKHAMRPVRPELDQTFMGEGQMAAAPTTEELRVATRKIIEETKKSAEDNKKLTESFEELKTFIAVQLRASLPANPQSAQPSAPQTAPHVLPPSRALTMPPVPSHGTEPQLTSHHQPASQRLVRTTCTYSIAPITLCPQISHDPSSGSSNIQQADSECSSESDMPAQADDGTRRTTRLYIPDIPLRLDDGRKSPRRDSWREIVEHWLHPDPHRGLFVALKDWPRQWLKDSSAMIAEKHHHRRIIAEEFIIQYNSNEAKFLADYPQASQNHTVLRKAIDLKREERGELIRRVSKKRRLL